jgi:hypothetical protein
MQVVKAERWHMVKEAGASDGAARRCSVCGSADLVPHDEAVLDAGTLRRYHVVRCEGCGYDLLEPVAAELAATC